MSRLWDMRITSMQTGLATPCFYSSTGWQEGQVKRIANSEPLDGEEVGKAKDTQGSAFQGIEDAA